MLRNLIKFELLLAFFYGLGRLDIVVLVLLREEASCLEVLH